MILSESWHKCISESTENYKKSANNLNIYDTVLTNDWAGYWRNLRVPMLTAAHSQTETAQPTSRLL